VEKKKLFTLIGAVAILSLGPTSAFADAIVYNLTTPNSDLSSFTGPYEQVTVNRTDATHATITFDSLTNGGDIYLMGANGAVGANVNGAFTLGTISGSNSLSGFTPGPWSNGGANNEDGFGSFSLTIDSFDGFTHSSTEISFLLTKSSGSWLSAADVLTPNASGQILAAHAFACAQPGCSSTSGAAATGYVSHAVSTVPEPKTTSLLLIGGLMMAIVFRKRVATN